MSASHRLRFIVAATVASGVVAGATQQASAQSIRVKPLPDRDGVVVAYRAQSHTAIVATISSGKLRSIHGLRRYSSGTRVRTRGIKWGAPVAGIKWFRAPRGIKWGIKWAMNGTYASVLDPTGRVTGLRIRGVVIARNRSALALATKGGVVTVVVPLALPAVTGSVLHAGTSGVGTIATIPVTISDGLVMARGPVHAVGSTDAIPVAGAISAISLARRTVTINATNLRVLPIRITMAVPSTMDISSLSVGDEVAAVATRRFAGGLRLKAIGPNRSFSQANDPTLQIVAPPPARPATLDQIDGLVNQVDAAVSTGQFTDPGVGLTARTQVRAIRTAAQDGDFPAAIGAVDAFATTIADGATAGVIKSQTASRLANLSSKLKARLQDPALR